MGSSFIPKHRATTEEESGRILAAIASLNAQAAEVYVRLHAGVAALALLQRQMAELAARLCTTSQYPAQAPPSTPGQMLRIADVVRRVGLGRPTVWLMVQEKTFPVPRRLGPRAVAWIEADVANWVLNLPPL